MMNKSFWTLAPRGRKINRISPLVLLAIAAYFLVCAPLFASHSEAPQWMHALVGVPLPTHDEKDSAVLLYSDENLTVLSADKFRTTVRRAYKILRPEGRKHYGTVGVTYDSINEKVVSIRAWCIPATGKDYEVTEKDSAQVAPEKGDVDSLISDLRAKVLDIPAPDPGNVVGYEYVKDWRPFVLQDVWDIQGPIPARECRYSLTLPSGWEYKEAWLNYPPVKAEVEGGVWQWAVGDVKRIREEEDMPPWRGLAGQMVVNLFPPGGAAANTLPTWHDLGGWYTRLTSDRLRASPEIKQEVSVLTASAPTTLAKIQALAGFVQRDIRYVAIELGIGGIQPHPAAQVFAHRYGDCKDKATLMQSMLREIGVDSFYVIINDERGSVTPATPAYAGAFNHAIVAIKLPDGLADPSLVATSKHPQLGTLLFFDPTNDKTTFGEIGGYLQANYGMMVTPSGGELVQLPQQPSAMNGIQRTGKLTLTISGDLEGNVEEVRVGDRAAGGREAFTSAGKESDRVKPVETLLADSLTAFRLTKATVTNVKETDNPFIWNYTFHADKYAKYAGNLLLVRPRVLGRKSSALLETSEPRRYDIEFDGPEQDTDNFEITLPSGYVVDDLPPAIDADFGFASYHSKTEVVGNVLHYQRTFEVKKLSVPASDAPQLKKFYRIIATDERNNAVLKLASP